MNLSGVSAGLGIRPELFASVDTAKPKVGFFEAHSENYFGESVARVKLRELRRHYPVSLHGVGLSLGRADNLDQTHLDNLRQLVREIEPSLISEHLAWSAYSHRHLPDLLPLPLTKQSLAVMCSHINQMQDFLQRQILVENPSNYLLFDQLQIPEPEFLNTLAARTGCGLLVDVNNIHVSSTNLQRNASDYIEQLNSSSIGQYHLAGYTQIDRHGEQLLIDTHNHQVYASVWRLFEQTIRQHGTRPTLVEWDSDFPELSVLLGECAQADRIVQNIESELSSLPEFVKYSPTTVQSEKVFDEQLEGLQQTFLNQLLNSDKVIAQAIEPHTHRIWVYQNNVFSAIREYLTEVYPAVAGVVGADYFKQMATTFIQTRPPSKGNIHDYGRDFALLLSDFDALSEIPYLSDLISYEWALHAAYFSTIVNIVNPDEYDQQQLLSLPIEYNDSVCVVKSDYPIYEIHRQSLPDYHGEVSINITQSQDSLLIYKHHYAVETRLLSDHEAVFFEKLVESENILQAIEGLHGSVLAESLSANLALVFELNLLSACNH